VDPRRLAAAIACSLVVAGAVVLLALAQRSPAAKSTPTTCGKPFSGNPPLSFDLPARYATTSGPGAVVRLRKLGDPRSNADLALALTAAQYNAGQIAAARTTLELAAAKLGDDDTRVSVATAMVAWSPARSADVERTLEGIASDTPTGDGLPLVERGIVALWRGCSSDATDWLSQAKAAGPDGFYGVLADDLLHLNQNAKYPIFISSVPLPGGSLETRRRAAAAHPDSSKLALAYAVALQQVGSRSKARAAAEQAVAADPTSLDAQVAAIVLGYDKDSPATAIGALGGLIKTNPNAVSPVFHLGLLLLWIHRNALAEQEFAKAVKLDPTGRIGKVAEAFLRPLKKADG
jgi:tetratricopeptide (TPR) repeat protein